MNAQRLPLEPTFNPPMAPTPLTASQEPAAFWRRFAAEAVDSLVLAVIQLPLFYLIVNMVSTGGPPAAESVESGAFQGVAFGIFYLAALAISWLYHGWFYQNRGATPGKQLLGIEVIDVRRGAWIGYGQTLLREVIGKSISSAVFMVGYLMALFRSDRRALHDLLASTQVVRRNESVRIKDSL